MPKLTMDASVEEKRLQLADMAHRGILGDKNEVGDFEFKNDIFLWSENDVLLYYSKNVTDEQADKYAEAVAQDVHHAELKQVVTGGKEPERPTVYSFKLLEKMNMITKMDLSTEEKVDKLNQIREAFVYDKLKFDAAHNSFKTEKDKKLYNDLTKEYSIDVYEQKAAAIEADKVELKKLDAQVKDIKQVPKKPNGFTRFLNGIGKRFFHKEFNSVKKYDEYKALVSDRTALQNKISVAESIMESISESNRNYNYEEHIKNKADRRMELAKDIVRRTLTGASKAEEKDVADITDEALEINAKAIMETKGFKKVMAELNADNVEVDSYTFYLKFMEEMSEKPATASSEKQGPAQPQKEASAEAASEMSI